MHTLMIAKHSLASQWILEFVMMIRCQLTWATSNEDIKVSNWHWSGANASNKKFLEMCTTQMVNIHPNWHSRFTSPLTRDWTYILFHSSLGCFRSRNVCSEEIWKENQIQVYASCGPLHLGVNELKYLDVEVHALFSLNASYLQIV